MVRIRFSLFFVYFLLNDHILDANGNRSTADISRALGMFEDCLWQQADMISDWMIETMQEIVNKLNKAERTFIFTIPDVHINDRKTERD